MRSRIRRRKDGQIDHRQTIISIGRRWFPNACQDEILGLLWNHTNWPFAGIAGAEVGLSAHAAGDAPWCMECHPENYGSGLAYTGPEYESLPARLA